MNKVTILLLVCFGAGLAADAAVTWDVPAWVGAGGQLRGKVDVATGVSDSPGSLECRYTQPDGTTGVASLTPVEGEPNEFQFAIDVGVSLGMLELTIAPDPGAAPTGGPCRVAIGESVELEISGAAAETLHFPLNGWPAEVNYVPCCNIYGGILQMVRFPDNPAGATQGLRGDVASDFVMALPDETVRATAGLSLRFHMTSDPSRARDAADSAGSRATSTAMSVFRWNGTKWNDVIGMNRDESGISFACADGGLFVLVRLP